MEVTFAVLRVPIGAMSDSVDSAYSIGSTYFGDPLLSRHLEVSDYLCGVDSRTPGLVVQRVLEETAGNLKTEMAIRRRVKTE